MATEFTISADTDGVAGTNCDYTSLANWIASHYISSANTDLTAAATQVYAGTETGTIADAAAVTLYRSGASQSVTATVVHVGYGGTQILVRSISNTGFGFAANDYWRVDDSNYFTISAAGDSAIPTAYVKASSGTADTTLATFNRVTSNTTNKLRVYPASGHRADPAAWSDTKYRLVNTTATGLVINDAYGEIDGIQISNEDTDSQRNCMSYQPSATGEWTVKNCRMRRVSSYLGSYGVGVFGTATSTLNLINCIITGVNTSGSASIYNNAANTTVNAYNVTIDGQSAGTNGAGLNRAAGTITAINCILYDCGGTYYTAGTLGSSSRNNVAGDITTQAACTDLAFGVVLASGTCTSTSAGHLVDSGANFVTSGVQIGCVATDGTNYTYIQNVTATDCTVANDIFANTENYTIYSNMMRTVTFRNAAGGDYTLSNTDTGATGYGYDNTAGGYTTDMRGTTRSTWDVGCHEYRINTGTGAISLLLPSPAGSGERASVGTGSFSIVLPTVAGEGEVESGSGTITGTGAISGLLPVVAGAGALTLKGTGGASIPLPTVAGAGERSPTFVSATVSIPLPTIAGTGDRASVGTGSITIPLPTFAGAGGYELIAPTTLYSGNSTAQSGAKNPTGIIDTTPALSAIVYGHPEVTVTHVHVQVSTTKDFATTEWDSGWIELDTPIATAARTEDITYGQA